MAFCGAGTGSRSPATCPQRRPNAWRNATDLHMLEESIAGNREAAESARGKFRALQETAEHAHGRQRFHREAWRAAVAALDAARLALQQQERDTAARRQQLSAIEEAHRRLGEGAQESRHQLAESEQRLQELSLPEELQNELQALREEVARRQVRHAEARAHHGGLEREARLRNDRLQSIESEHRQWSERSRQAAVQIADLKARAEAARLAIEELTLVPRQIEDRRTKLLTLLSEAEAAQRTASDELTAGESRFQQADGAQRAANERLSQTREEHARSGALAESAILRQQERQRRIAEQFNCTAEELGRTADAEKLREPEAIERRLGQLRDERERLGGVNLLAEQEAATVQTQLEGLKRERDDLVQAIAKLRGGVQSLNREGRQRLIAAFDAVNRNFGALFTNLFSGGRAELQLIESDDPLEAGLEILAHPPGKKPQVLSLLSGGEQALTALALIFAVFLTNPAPICVLDEVDAPLDDHNVERFCNLLDAMLERTETRFLIITHHPLTMTRMHRLFGVTMMERGVSQLVSVDLKIAEGLREAS